MTETAETIVERLRTRTRIFDGANAGAAFYNPSDADLDMETIATILTLTDQRDALEKEVGELKRSLTQSLWQIVFLDGRNEHGSHVLPMPGNNIFGELTEDLLHEDAELIISEAEKLGYAIGHCVVTLWRTFKVGDGCEAALEYIGISELLTDVLCGRPLKQSDLLGEKP